MKQRPIRVLYFIDNLDSGGTQRQLTLLLNNIDPTQVAATLCTYQPERDFFLAHLDRSRVDVVCIPKTRKIQISFLVALVRLMRRRNFDLVHSYLRSSNVWGCLAGRFARRTKVLVSERRAEFGTSLTDRLVSSAVMRFAHLISTNSRVAGDRLAAVLNVPREKIVIIRNGIPPMKASGSFPGAGCTFTMAATFVANKNHRCVVEAFDRAFADLPQPAVLQFVGNEEDGTIRSDLERFLAGRPCAGAVRFFGRRDDIECLFSASHAVVLASFNEAFPNVLLEAMLCERPVLASRVCEHPEIVGEAGERGWLFDPNRPEELAAAMVELGRTTIDRRARMGSESRRWVQENFSVAQMVDQTIAVYRRMLDVDRVPAPSNAERRNEADLP